MRQRKRRANLADRAADPTLQPSAGNPEREAIEHERSQAVQRAIAALDEKHRLPIVLRYYHELSTQEIADVLGINLGTVHSRLSIARQQLNGVLQRTATGRGGIEP